MTDKPLRALQNAYMPPEKKGSRCPRIFFLRDLLENFQRGTIFDCTRTPLAETCLSRRKRGGKDIISSFWKRTALRKREEAERKKRDTPIGS